MSASAFVVGAVLSLAAVGESDVAGAVAAGAAAAEDEEPEDEEEGL